MSIFETMVSQPGFEFPVALSEKYRPRKIGDFIGLDKVQRVLGAFVNRPMPSAWLFVGASGTGKSSMALAIREQLGAERFRLNPAARGRASYTRRKVHKMNRQRGAILIEAAFVFPVFLLLILGGFDLLWCEHAKAQVDWLAGQAAVCIDTPGCNAVAYLAQGPIGLDPARLTATVNGKTVTIIYEYQPVGPVFPHLTLTSTATAP